MTTYTLNQEQIMLRDLQPNTSAPPSRKAVIAALKEAQKPTPDCRTCANVVACMDVIGEITYCTNGDKYQQSAPVVLWRTE